MKDLYYLELHGRQALLAAMTWTKQGLWLCEPIEGEKHNGGRPFEVSSGSVFWRRPVTTEEVEMMREHPYHWDLIASGSYPPPILRRAVQTPTTPVPEPLPEPLPADPAEGDTYDEDDIPF